MRPKILSARLSFSLAVTAAVLLFFRCVTFVPFANSFFHGPSKEIDMGVGMATALIGFFVMPKISVNRGGPLMPSLSGGALAGVVTVAVSFLVSAAVFLIGAGISTLKGAQGAESIVATLSILLVSFLVGAIFLLVPALPFGAVAGMLWAMATRLTSTTGGNENGI